MKFIDKIPMQTVVIAALFLGFAPFLPEPHIWQKLKMLMAGELVRPVDIGDFLFHGAPWVLLVVKIMRNRSRKDS